MATYNTEKFYWLKLKRDFFKRHDITIIENMPNGKDYVLFYLKLLCESIDHTGELRFSDTIPYDEQMLASITSTNIDIVRSAMKVFVSLKMVDILDDKTIYMRGLNGMIGEQTFGAERKQIQRENSLKYLPKKTSCGQEVDKCPPEIEKDIEIDKDKKKYIKKKSRFTPPTPEEVTAYCKERHNNVDAQRFVDFYASKGWFVGKNKMKDWKAAVRTWEHGDKKADKPKGSALDQMKRICEKFDGEENGTG